MVETHSIWTNSKAIKFSLYDMKPLLIESNLYKLNNIELMNRYFTIVGLF